MLNVLRRAQVCVQHALLLRSVKGTTLRNIWSPLIFVTGPKCIGTGGKPFLSWEKQSIFGWILLFALLSGSLGLPEQPGVSLHNGATRAQATNENTAAPRARDISPKAHQRRAEMLSCGGFFQGWLDQPAGIFCKKKHQLSVPVARWRVMAGDVISSRRVSDSVSSLGFVHGADLHTKRL